MSTDQFNLNISDSSRVWSLCTVEMPFMNGNNEPDYHCFLILKEESPTPRILDELHFVPVDSEGKLYNNSGNSNAQREGTKGPEVPSVPYLGANAYTKTGRDLTGLDTVSYDNGAPAKMLHIWNSAFHAALEIRDLKRPFERGDCRAGAEGVIESLGYKFETGSKEIMHWGLDAKLAAKITSHSPGPSRPDTTSVLTAFRTLHENLDARRLAYNI